MLDFDFSRFVQNMQPCSKMQADNVYDENKTKTDKFIKIRGDLCDVPENILPQKQCQ